MPANLIVWWAIMHAMMKCDLTSWLRLIFFHITKKIVLVPWAINCAGADAGSHHFLWLSPAACSTLQLARHSQLDKSVLFYTPMVPTCKDMLNVIIIVPGHLFDFSGNLFWSPQASIELKMSGKDMCSLSALVFIMYVSLCQEMHTVYKVILYFNVFTC